MKKLTTVFAVGVSILLFGLMAAGFYKAVRPNASAIRRIAENIFSFSQRDQAALKSKKRSSPDPVVRVFQPVRVSARAWTSRELATKAELEQMLETRRPTHRLVYDGTRITMGSLLEEHPGYIVFSQQYGETGSMSVQITRSRIVRIEECEQAAPEITRRDVRFRMQFPTKHFYKSPPYTIISEESFFAVEDIVRMLQNLFVEISREFAPLITDGGCGNDIQLLILSCPREYAAIRPQEVIDIASNSGFYSHQINRMVVLHQRNASWVVESSRQIDRIARQHEQALRSPQARGELDRWKNSERSRLLAAAGRVTNSTIRHEGAHHLLFSLGIQNPAQSGRGWVTEGLATYCETKRVGQINPGRLNDLRKALDTRQRLSLRSLMTEDRLKTAMEYAQAWALVHLLMQPQTRTGFFEYLDWLRMNPGPAGRNPFGELCRFIQMTPAELEKKWIAHIRRLNE